MAKKSEVLIVKDFLHNSSLSPTVYHKFERIERRRWHDHSGSFVVTACGSSLAEMSTWVTDLKSRESKSILCEHCFPEEV